jgi:heat shock protein HtpX|tara:strand:+ start:531 stop:848 length:318 start_codon:yes stop_codon:yes gene_type:complete
VPEIAIYNTAEIKCFAAVINRNNALAAMSTGLLGSSGRDEAEAVFDYEISYIVNGDVVTSIFNSGCFECLRFFVRVAAHAISRGNNNRFVYFMTAMVFKRCSVCW